jgi:enoyl-CoA hydratase/carnithine racemase
MYTLVECELLYRQVDLSNAKRILYSGRSYKIEDCVSMRLIDVAAPDAHEAALALAREFVGNALLSIRGSKFVLESIAARTAAVRASDISSLMDRTLQSYDYLEARKAFNEKRPPRFRGE